MSDNVYRHRLAITVAALALALAAPNCSKKPNSKVDQTKEDPTNPAEDPKQPGDPADPGDPPVTGQQAEYEKNCPNQCCTGWARYKDDMCTGTCKNCTCTEMAWECSTECYKPGANCVINGVGPDGKPAANGTNCQGVGCSPEDDVSPKMACNGTECEEVAPPAPNVLPFDRQVTEAGVIVSIDTSGSMQSKQEILACTVDAFLEATSTAKWDMGIMTGDVLQYYSGTTLNGTPPHLVGLDGPCQPLPCDCSRSPDGNAKAPCSFNTAGAVVNNADPDAQNNLRRLFVQGSNEDSNNDEANAEKCVLRILAELKNKQSGAAHQTISQCVVVSDETFDSDKEMCPIQANRDLAPFREVLGPGFNPPANTGDCKKDLENFYVYFFTQNPGGIQLHALCDSTGVKSNTHCTGYMAIATATGGNIGDIYGGCTAFQAFWTGVGAHTTDYSRGYCPGQDIDQAKAVLTYTANGSSEVVPKSTSDGWSWDANKKCIVFHGTWASKLGSYELSY